MQTIADAQEQKADRELMANCCISGCRCGMLEKLQRERWASSAKEWRGEWATGAGKTCAPIEGAKVNSLDPDEDLAERSLSLIR
eukprot:2098097-Prymnesium_polylepis.1